MKSVLRVLVTSTLFALMAVSGCAFARPSYYTDTTRVYSGEANVQPMTPAFRWVLMSEDKFQQLNKQ